MTSRDSFKQVTRAEFRAFLSAYVGQLEHDCVTMAEPPIHNYCDWSKSDPSLGTGEAHEKACQAYCVYGDDDQKGGKFFIRIGTSESAA